MMSSDLFLRRAAKMVVAIGVVLFLATALTLFVPQLRGLWLDEGSSEPVYRVGGLIDVPSDYYESSVRTLFIFARSSCGACVRAEPLLRRLVLYATERDDDELRLVVVTTGRDMAAELEYASSLGAPTEALVQAPDKLRLALVPTVVVVGREGRIQFSREGILYSAESETEIVAAVQALAGRVTPR